MWCQLTVIQGTNTCADASIAKLATNTTPTQYRHTRINGDYNDGLAEGNGKKGPPLAGPKFSILTLSVGRKASPPLFGAEYPALRLTPMRGNTALACSVGTLRSRVAFLA